MNKTFKNRIFDELKIFQQHMNWALPVLSFTLYIQLILSKNLSTYLYVPTKEIFEDFGFELFKEREVGHWIITLQIFYWVFLIFCCFIPSMNKSAFSKNVFGTKIFLKCIFVLFVIEMIRFISLFSTLIPDPKSKCINDELDRKPESLKGTS